MPVPVLLVDDHGIIAEPLKLALGAYGFDRVSSIAEDLRLDRVLAAAREVDAGIVLLDLHLGNDQLGVPMIGPLIDMGAKVVLFTASREPRLIAAGLRAGAEAVIDKAMAFDRLVSALVNLASGAELMPPQEREALIAAFEEQFQDEDRRRASFATLTERESEVLRRILAGDSPKAIARKRRSQPVHGSWPPEEHLLQARGARATGGDRGRPRGSLARLTRSYDQVMPL
jgi:DNA-binding NarL/FixJ family response regulator